MKIFRQSKAVDDGAVGLVQMDPDFFTYAIDLMNLLKKSELRELPRSITALGAYFSCRAGHTIYE